MFHMEQKNFKFEIVDQLLKGKKHIRRIAVDLSINHMMIIRKMRALAQENVVDYEEEGKNKLYFLKKTSEARAYVYKAENYKLVCLLRKYPGLRGIIEKIQKNRNVKIAILFGSFAKGIAKNDSDIDIYIDTTKKELKKEVEQNDSRANVKIGKFDKSSPLTKEIIKNHVIIKGVEQYYEKNKIFD